MTASSRGDSGTAWNPDTPMAAEFDDDEIGVGVEVEVDSKTLWQFVTWREDSAFVQDIDDFRNHE